MRKKILATVGVVAAMFLGANPAASQDWPMFHCDLALSGYATCAAPNDNTLLWECQTGANVQASPVVWEGKVYVGNMAGTFQAIDAFTGVVIWTFDHGSAIHSTAAVAYGNVYFLADSGDLYALNALTGAMVWTAPGLVGPWSWSCPAIKDGRLFVAASNGNMHCFDAMTGGAVWTTYVGGSPDGPIAVMNGKVFTGTHNFDNSSPTVVALDEMTGAIVWTYDYFRYHGGVVGMINSNGVAVADEDEDGSYEIYFGVYNWFGVGPQAVCLNEADGTERWAVSINANSTSTPAVHDGRVFIGSDDGGIYALDAMTGTQLWSFMTADKVWAAPAVADGKVFVGSHDHTFYALDETDGALIWSYFTGASRLTSSPAIANRTVYVGNENGKVYAFGTPVVPVAFDIKPGSCPNPLAVNARGVLPTAIVGTDDLDVYDVDLSTLLLEGVNPTRMAFEDVATPVEREECECHGMGADGYMDLTVKFDVQAIVAVIGPQPDRTVVPLTLTGMLYDGTPIEGVDCVWIIGGDDQVMAAAGDGIELRAVAGPGDRLQRVAYTLPGPTRIRLSVYDVSGRRVDELVSSVVGAGTHTAEWDATRHSNGVYFLRLEAGSLVETQKVVLVR